MSDLPDIPTPHERRIAELEGALFSLVLDVEQYQQINNLHPNPGKPDCWQSVTRAKEVLQKLQRNW